MGSGEEETTPTAKPTKTTPPTQEPIPAPPSYNDWSTHMQAYYGAGGTPPPFFPPNVASPPPPPHPYMWGNQHLMAPYGTPLPYPPLYPPPGLYPHQNMAMVQDTAVTTTETGKGPNGKEQVPTKKSKGNSGAIVGKSKESGKVTSGSGNDGASQSAESGSEGSSDSSDENTNQRESSAATKRSFNQMLADGANAQVNHTAQYNDAAVDSSLTATGVPATNPPTSMPGNPVGTIPGTNLNIGMDLWNASPVGNVPLRARPNASGVASAVGPVKMVGREGAAPEHLWVQDERELKRQKRKQSNRESARRSRLRKQAECEELQAKVDTLGNENHNLHKELQRLSEECEKLTSENSNLVEELKHLYGPEAISSLNGNNGAAPPVQSINGEGPQVTEHNTSMENPELVSGPMSGNFFNSNNNNSNNLEPGSN